MFAWLTEIAESAGILGASLASGAPPLAESAKGYLGSTTQRGMRLTGRKLVDTSETICGGIAKRIQDGMPSSLGKQNNDKEIASSRCMERPAISVDLTTRGL